MLAYAKRYAVPFGIPFGNRHKDGYNNFVGISYRSKSTELFTPLLNLKKKLDLWLSCFKKSELKQDKRKDSAERWKP